MKLNREERDVLENCAAWGFGIAISVATWALIIWAVVSFLR